MIVQVVAFGNDTDTTARIAAGLAGIRWGVWGIPPRWLISTRKKAVADHEIALHVTRRPVVEG